MYPLVVAFGLVICATAQTPKLAELAKDFQRLESLIKDMKTIQDTQKQVISSLARQVSMQQLYAEELTRSTFNSGLKQLRTDKIGTRSYHQSTFTSSRMAAIHDHSNYIRTIGMGEVVAVLNGVEFRTRHNDYHLTMPHRTSSAYGATEYIEFPEVPPPVLAKKTIDDEIAEMREWFKAWKNQDYSKRDYRKYFKAVLCYMEGMWTVTDKSGDIDEPFESDRHAIDAANWFDLQEKTKFTSYTGRKDNNENLAFLPTTIVDLDADGFPIYAQWNYDILCHPIQDNLPVNRFKVVDDISNRVARGKSITDYSLGREARFQLWPEVQFSGVMKDQFLSGETFIDKLMYSIPGKDNYPANIIDDAFNTTIYTVDTKFYQGAKPVDPAPLNAGYYHRSFKAASRDAMGVNTRSRGFSDAALYVALNSQKKIAPAKVNYCKRNRNCYRKDELAGLCTKQTCSQFEQRVSYAIPLEIIYLTPLSKWNPYNIKHFDNANGPRTSSLTNGLERNGGKTAARAYAGSSNSLYYKTPSAFFMQGNETSDDPADTGSVESVGVLDGKGKMREVTSSGYRVILPSIPGVGSLRLRYPIAPVAHAGNMVYKEVDALKELVFKAAKYSKLYPDKAVSADGSGLEEVYNFEVKVATVDPPGEHSHTFELTESDIKLLKSGKPVTVTTSASNGHDHELVIRYGTATYKSGPHEYVYISECDGAAKTCWDGHTGWASCIDCVSGFPNPQ